MDQMEFARRILERAKDDNELRPILDWLFRSDRGERIVGFAMDYAYKYYLFIRDFDRAYRKFRETILESVEDGLDSLRAMRL